MMMTAEAGGKIASIELAALTPDEMKKAGEPQEGPGRQDVFDPEADQETDDQG